MNFVKVPRPANLPPVWLNVNHIVGVEGSKNPGNSTILLDSPSSFSEGGHPHPLFPTVWPGCVEVAGDPETVVLLLREVCKLVPGRTFSKSDTVLGGKKRKTKGSTYDGHKYPSTYAGQDH